MDAGRGCVSSLMPAHMHARSPRVPLQVCQCCIRDRGCQQRGYTFPLFRASSNVHQLAVVAVGRPRVWERIPEACPPALLSWCASQGCSSSARRRTRAGCCAEWPAQSPCPHSLDAFVRTSRCGGETWTRSQSWCLGGCAGATQPQHQLQLQPLALLWCLVGTPTSGIARTPFRSSHWWPHHTVRTSHHPAAMTTERTLCRPSSRRLGLHARLRCECTASTLQLRQSD